MSFLSMLNGRLRVAGCGGALVVTESANEPCCCCDCSNESGGNCSFSSSGLLDPDNYGWFVDGAKLTETNQLPIELPVEAEFKYEDAASYGCGGSNGNRQIGNISCCFCLNEETDVEIKVSGKMEQQDAGFDYGTLNVDGTQVQISSYDRNLECQMIDDEDSTTLTLSAGKHTYTFSADTVDGQWHTGMTHKFSIKKVGG